MGSSLLPWACLLARILPLCLLLAKLTRNLLGWSVALSLAPALAAGLSLAVLPGPASLSSLGGSLLPILILIARELCLGSLVALALLLPVSAAGWAARFSEVAAGPWGMREGPISTLYVLAATYLSLTLGLHRSLLIGLHESMRLAPIASPSFASAEFGLGVVRLVADALVLSLALGLPLLCSCLLIESVLGLLRRVLGRASADALGASLSRPLFYLVASALLWPAVSQVPSALRHGARALRELTLRIAS
jgi:flagellar biosynthesis protein FliR